MDTQTEKLALLSLKMNIPQGLSGIRVRDELVSILQQKEPEKAVRKLYAIGALDSIGIHLESTSKLMAHIKNAIEKYEKIVAFKEINILMWRALISLMLLYSKNSDVNNFCYSMKIKKKDSAVINEINNDYVYLKKTLAKKIIENSLLYDTLVRTSGEMLLIISAAGKNHYDNVLKFLCDLSGIKTEISGNDLKNLKIEPSKKYRIILKEILKLKLDNKIKTRQEELKTAVKFIEKLK